MVGIHIKNKLISAFMIYRINEIFYSLQGEGFNTGRAAVFVRSSGCNMSCPFCDTDFHDYVEMTEEDIYKQVKHFPTRFMVLTGGEPSLQVDDQFVNYFHQMGYELAMETNGTCKLPKYLDWITVSPKGACVVARCDEVKVLFGGNKTSYARPLVLSNLPEASYYYLQPCFTDNPEQNQRIMNECVEYIKRHPQWRLSAQVHKLVGFH